MKAAFFKDELPISIDVLSMDYSVTLAINFLEPRSCLSM